jgi:protein tyrosine kinase modulator
MALPNVYTSYATVLVEPQTVDDKLVRAGVVESDLNQRLHLMTAQILSRPRLSRIIDELGIYKSESEYMLREEVIDLMRSRIRVEPVTPDLESAVPSRQPTEINEFQIFFDDYDSKVARDVAQRLANDFIETHINDRVQISQKSLDFIEGELERLATKIRSVEAEIAKVKNENPGRLPEDMAANQRRLERILGDLATAQRSLATATSDEAFYRSQLATAQMMAGGTGDASPARRLELLKLQLAEYESKGYTEKHPDVINVKNEIAALQANIESAAKNVADNPGFNPLAQQTEAEARRAQLRRQAAEAEIERLQGLADEVYAQLNQTPQVAEQLDALNRDYQHLSESFKDFSNRQQEATVQAQLERRQLGEQFRVLEAAFQAPEPSAPKRLLILILGALFGLAVGAGVGLLLEAIDTSAHEPRQLQGQLQLPVLVSIPEIWLESDRVRQRRRRIRQVFATAGLVAFALVGGAVNYMWVNGAPGFVSALVSGEKPPSEKPAEG